MRLGTTALVASALTGLLYFSAPSASALPGAARPDVAGARAPGITQEVRHWRRGYRRWGYRPFRYHRPYRYYGYGYPYYYRPYYYGGYGYPYYYRRPGFYLGY